MVNEREEDKKKSDVFHLWVKLNIPKEEEEEQGTDIVDQKIGFRNYKDLMMMNKNCNNTERVCHICHKVFGSGKALGGHMRIHVIQGAANKKDDPILKNKLKLHRTITFKKEEGANPRRENVFDFPKKKEAKTKSTVTPKCTICGKEFPSMKSLFGHMRSHPEREWRGIHPPASASIAKNTSSSFSSSLSEAEPPKTDEISPSAEKNKAVDLAESLQGWAVTARRGRKAATTAESSSPEFSSSDDDQLLQAVTYLMMLSRGGENKMADRYCKSEILEVEKGGVVAAENVAVYNGESDDKLDGVKESCVVEHHHDHMETDFDKARVMIKNRRKRKKVKLCDLGSPKSANPMTPLMTCKTASSSPDKYKCSSCERSFTTHQALGGHMSSHNRSNNITIIHNNSVPEKNESIVCDEHPIMNSQVDEETERRGSMSSNMVLEFDLNEAPPSSDGEAGFDPSVFCTW